MLFGLIKTQAERAIDKRIEYGQKYDIQYSKKKIRIFNNLTTNTESEKKKAYEEYAKELLEFFDNEFGNGTYKGDGTVSKREFIEGQIYLNAELRGSTRAKRKEDTRAHYRNALWGADWAENTARITFDKITENHNLTPDEYAKLIERFDANDGKKDGIFSIEDEWQVIANYTVHRGFGR